MIHNGVVVDKDPYFVIDPITRIITNQSTNKVNIIQFDHNSERFTFSMPRIVEGHDMSECNVVQVHYANTDAVTMEQTTGIYTVDDLQIDENDNETITLSWLLSQNVTQRVGKLEFLIRFACTDTESNIMYAWNTAIFDTIKVAKGMNNTDVIEQTYPDVLVAKEDRLNKVYSITGKETSEKYPTVLAVMEYVRKNGGSGGGGMTEQEIRDLFAEIIESKYVSATDTVSTPRIWMHDNNDWSGFVRVDANGNETTMEQTLATKANEMKLLYSKKITADDGNVSYIEFLPETPLKKIYVYTYCPKDNTANTNKLFFKFGSGSYITDSTGHANIATDSAMWGIKELDLEQHKHITHGNNIKTGYPGSLQSRNNLYPYSGTNTFWTAIYDTSTFEVINLLNGIKFSTNSDSVYFPIETMLMVWGC